MSAAALTSTLAVGVLVEVAAVDARRFRVTLNTNRPNGPATAITSFWKVFVAIGPVMVSFAIVCRVA